MDIKRSGAFIAALRKDEGLTQKELANELGVTDKAVSRWETGSGLPDAATLLTLSERFGVSINELLLGERVTAVDATVQTAEINMVEVLQMYDDEKKRSRRFHRMTIAICALVAVILSAILFPSMVGQISGDGQSFSAMYCTHLARKTVRLMEKGKFERAARHIGFARRPDPEASREQWVDAATEIFSEELKILSFEIVSPLREDDQYIVGKAHLTVEDLKTSQTFVLSIDVFRQDGISFFLAYGASDSRNRDFIEREDELCLLFKANFSTFLPYTESNPIY
ncbi:MAG: helix-turn-helix transcriptional regulator [Clostridia bacterium]|nr:helix-turn-helix transcriptional regulator [Clostridia bacterium]